MVLGYIVDDRDCEDPTTSTDSNGNIYTNHRRQKEHQSKIQKALGLNEYWSPDFSSITNEDIAKHMMDHDCSIDEAELAIWKERRLLGQIGQLGAVPLDIYEHGNIQYVVSSKSLEDHLDETKFSALWVPDDLAMENIIHHVFTKARRDLKEVDPKAYVEEVNKVAREYARPVVDEYSSWCNGETYGYVVAAIDAKTGAVESYEDAYGLVGWDNATSEMHNTVFSIVNSIVHKPQAPRP